MIGSVFYLLSVVALCGCAFFYPKSAERQNAVVWIAVTILAYECWLAFVGGVFSLAHVPVSIATVGIANIVMASVIVRKMRKLEAAEPPAPGRRFFVQLYTVRVIDLLFVLALAVVVARLALERFGDAAPIIYATIDPADRLSRANQVMAGASVIYYYPNMYFGDMASGMFMQMLDPAFPGILSYRAFEIKEAVNLWLAGLLFYAGLRQYSSRNFSCGFFFLLAFVYTLGYPWNNELFGFGYLGISVNLIIFTAIGAKLLYTKDVKPFVGLAVISMGCLGTGLSYTLFAPPLYVAAFLAIGVWLLRRENEKRMPPTIFEFAAKRFVPVQLAVFVLPVAFTCVFTMLLGREEGISVGSQLTEEGAIFRNLFSDFLPWLPFALVGALLIFKKPHLDFIRIFAVIFALFQAYFFLSMWKGSVSTYYYFKLNFVLWFVVLFLAGIAVDVLANRKKSVAFVTFYTLVWGVVAVLGVTGLEMRLTAKNYNINPVTIPLAGACFQVYSTNNLYQTELPQNVVYVDEPFIDLCDHARTLRGPSNDGSFNENRVGAVCDIFRDAYWVDCLVDEHIETQPVTGIFELPHDGEKIWVVLKDSELYKNNKDYVDGLERAYENEIGFVALAG
ncbi:MAG: hypothetical protein LBR44_06855 [Clostridiales Family XIII bacterium]|jgi:hypothetical protein|nr:hypothetical protein [Clostridiales Family XIII bacterium]